jgi:hypothetical protein
MTISKPIIIEHNTETGEIIEREMNAAEYKKHQSDKAITEANAAAFAAKSTERQAIADRLGLTADELKVLLG